MNTPLLPRILMLLLSGMVINIALALGCATWSTFPQTGQEAVTETTSWPREVSPRWPRKRVLVSREQAFGLTSIKSWAVVQRRKDPTATLTYYVDVLRSRTTPVLDQSRRIDATIELLRSIQLNVEEPLDKTVDKVIAFLRDEAVDLDEETRNEIKQLILSLTDRNTNFSLYVREAGWPMRCLEAEARSDKSLEPRGRYAIQLPRSRAGILMTKTGRWLPIYPIMPGFLINSLFFALILSPLSLVPAATRRALRRAGGQCPECGSPIGVDSICQQCGQHLDEFWGDSRQ